MTIHVTCECGKSLHAPDQFAGRQTRCPACQRTLVLPAAAAAIKPVAAPPAPPAPAGAQRAPAPGMSPGLQPAPGKSKQAVISLILGCVAFCLPLVLSVPAIVLGFLGLSAIKKSGGQLGGKGLAIAGLVLGFVTLPLFFFYVYVSVAALGKARDAADRISATNSLKQIGLAMHVYHDGYKVLPTEGGGSKPVQSRLSWRVQILPALEQEALYKRFRQNEPWDSPTNKALLSEMPNVYLDRRFQTDADRVQGLTYFRGFVVQDSVLGSPSGLSLGQITVANGALNTIVVVEAGDPVPWTKPEDPSFNGDSPFGGPERVDFLVLYADIHVTLAKRNTDRKAIRALIRWNNTEMHPAP